jgi:anti-sigma B factor antagonist
VADLTVRTKRDGKVAVLSLAGEARLERIGPFRAEARALRAAGVESVLLDLTGLSFADSASVGAFVEIQRACQEAGGRMVLFGCPPRLARQLADMGLEGRFPISPDEASALRSVPR